MSKEVKGEPEGYTLLQAIDDGKVPVPGKMKFPEWQRWRKREGLRPTVRVDGRGTSTAEEVAVWEAVMAARYGAEALEALADDEESPNGSADDAPGAQGSGQASGVLSRPSGTTGVEGGGRVSAAVTEGLPGEGVAIPGAGTGLETPPRRTGRVLRPEASNASDSSQSGPVTPAGLQDKLFRLYDPAKETLEAYDERVDRIAEAMETLGNDVDWDAVTLLKAKAEVLFQVWNLNGQKPYRPAQGVNFLKEMFLVVSMDTGLS